jgi:hypothetical protein
VCIFNGRYSWAEALRSWFPWLAVAAVQGSIRLITGGWSQEWKALRLVACWLAYFLRIPCGQLHLSPYHIILSIVASTFCERLHSSLFQKVRSLSWQLDYIRSTHLRSLDSWPRLQFAAVPRLPFLNKGLLCPSISYLYHI